MANKIDNKEQIKKIGKHIAVRRMMKGMTQQDLAEKIGTSKSNISRMESGNQNLSLDTLMRVAYAFQDELSMELREPSEIVYDAENTDYVLKLYDEVLVGFKMTRELGLSTIATEITYINDKKKHLLPIDLELTNEGVINWLKNRSVPSNRQFANEFLMAVGLNSKDTKGIIDLCKGLSLNDSYWVVPKSFTGKFDEYNLYDNRFDEVIGIMAYTGNYYGGVEFRTSPEFTTNGMLRKAWRYKNNNEIWLYKGGTEGFANTGNEPFCEFYACQVAEKMGLNAVHYELENWKGILASICKLFTDKDTSYIPIGRIVKTGGIDACAEYIKNISDEAYQDFCSMLAFDAVVFNEDRHFGNFGVLRDNKSGKLKGLAPIFDNGISLFCYAMKDDFDNLAKYASERTNPYRVDYIDVCKKYLGSKQKSQLRKLIGFKFERSDLMNLPEWRLKKIEKMIQKRVAELLD